MSFFNKNISRKIANQKLETKLLLSTIGIDLLFLFFFLVAAFSIITSRYHKLLYQSMQSSSSLVSYEFTNRLEDLVIAGFMLLVTSPFFLIIAFLQSNQHWMKSTSPRKTMLYIITLIFILLYRNTTWNTASPT
jgi:hypothetical protein